MITLSFAQHVSADRNVKIHWCWCRPCYGSGFSPSILRLHKEGSSEPPDMRGPRLSKGLESHGLAAERMVDLFHVMSISENQMIYNILCIK